MKNQYNSNYLEALAKEAKSLHAQFNATIFIQKALDKLDGLELKARIAHIGEAYFDALDRNYEQFYQLCVKIFEANPSTGRDVWKNGIKYDPLAHIVAHHGTGHFDWSMHLLAEITQRYTSEFAIRYFLLKYPEKTLAQMLLWSKSDNEHLRRLSSEGSRSRLPWGQKLQMMIDQANLTEAILEQLHQDPSKYVQKSVANHLNDISKDNPSYFYEVIARWSKRKNSNTQWIIKHALRNEIKKGHPIALKTLGFNKASFTAAQLSCDTPQIKIGESGRLFCSVKSEANQAEEWVIDYAVHLVKSNGSTFKKVFKWKTLSVAGSQKLELSKKLDFKAITTRVYYPGIHLIELYINGQLGAHTNITLV